MISIPRDYGLRATCGAGLVDALGAGQVAQRELAHGAHAGGDVGAVHAHDQQAVRARGVGVDVVAAHRAVLEAGGHDVEDLLRRRHLCAGAGTYQM
jgi:hypothetical protein